MLVSIIPIFSVKEFTFDIILLSLSFNDDNSLSISKFSLSISFLIDSILFLISFIVLVNSLSAASSFVSLRCAPSNVSILSTLTPVRNFIFSFIDKFSSSSDLMLYRIVLLVDFSPLSISKICSSSTWRARTLFLSSAISFINFMSLTLSLLISDILSSIFVRSIFVVSFIFCLILMMSESIGVRSTPLTSILFNFVSNSDILFLIIVISLSVIFNLLDKDVLMLEILFEMRVISFLNELLFLDNEITSPFNFSTSATTPSSPLVI